MKRIIIFLSFSLFNLFAYGQTLTQSAEGTSSIPLPGSIASLDLTKSELSIGYNNIDKKVKDEKIELIYGGLLKVKNESGLGNLFSTGYIVPYSEATLFGGFTLSDLWKRQVKEEEGALQKFNLQISSLRSGMVQRISTKILSLDSTIHDEKERNTFDSVVRRAIHPLSIEDYHDRVKNLHAGIASIDTAYEKLKSYSETEFNSFNSSQAIFNVEYVQKLKELHSKFRKESYNRLTVFGFGGISDISFKKFDKVDSSNLSNSFKSIDDRGGKIGMGLNYQLNNLWLGLTYDLSWTNNFSILTGKEYNLRTETVIKNQTLIEEKKILAYPGTYGKLKVNNLNFDLVWRLKLDSTYKNALLINPYFRGLYSKDTSLLLNKLNIGIGIYFLQKKFLGGLYVELPDINNSEEKAKPVQDQNLRSPLRRLTFGITTKLNLSSIIDW